MESVSTKASPFRKLHSRIMATGYEYLLLEQGRETEDAIAVESHDTLNKKPKSQKSGDCRLKAIAIISFLIIVALVIFIAWQHFTTQRQEVCTTPDCVTTSAYIISLMNTTQDPCDNFYEYACGGWEHNTVIPPDKAKYGSFQELETKNKALLKKILDSKGTMYKGANSTSVGKAKTLYKNCMDKQAVENLGIVPALKLIKKLGSWTVTSDPDSGTWEEGSWSFMDTLVDMHKLNRPAFFLMTVSQDDMHSDKNIITFQQSGLTLGEREEYTGNNSQKFKKAFLGFATQMGELLGGDNSTLEKMTKVYDLEKSLAEIFMPKEELVDPVATYNKMTLEAFKTMIGSQFSIKAYADKLFETDIPLSEEIVVYTVDYFKKLGDIIKNTPKEVLANYLMWQLFNILPGYLPEKFVDAALILTKAETGVSDVGPRWQRCVFKTTAALPFVTGALFVQEKFPPDSKQEVLNIIDDIENAFMRNLNTVAWMDEQTRDIAIEKVKAVTDMIGYPDYILDPEKLDRHYENMTIPDGQFLLSRISVLTFQKGFNLNKRGKKPDRKEWDMAPSDVNAYYSPSNNQIVFPAGILHKPFFNPQFPLSFRYGSLGMIVGHELTHGFDNKGRNYDKDGNLHSWWTNSSARGFEEETACMINQYSQYTVEGIHLNGKYTLGENIADNGGLKTSYSAYQMAKHSSGTPPKLPGMSLTPDQLFYVGFAQIWCSYYTPEYAKQTVMTDVHSNAKYRVIGPVSNSYDFSSVFKCPAGAPMNPSKKCTVW
ncbi:endothelin-converting enzyme homolog isoform X2 [Haliotis cracherodii]|uniref:endothelin-converting enzyme homolog isoform X2 n=1 Tax=Haliotis cracherodii TaxID=6455 RepID=UPI0039E7EA85